MKIWLDCFSITVGWWFYIKSCLCFSLVKAMTSFQWKSSKRATSSSCATTLTWTPVLANYNAHLINSLSASSSHWTILFPAFCRLLDNNVLNRVLFVLLARNKSCQICEMDFCVLLFCSSSYMLMVFCG